MQTISFITQSGAIKEILYSLKMATAPPEIGRDCFVPEQTELIYDYAE